MSTELGFAIVLFYSFLLALMLAIPVGLYVMQALGLSRLCKTMGAKSPWLAWLPVGDLYSMGFLAEQSNLHCGKKKGAWRIVLPVLVGLCFILIPVFITFLVLVALFLEEMAMGEEFIILPVLLFYFAFLMMSVLMSVLTYIVLYKIYKLFAPDSAAVYLVLSIFLSATPIILFLLRDKTPPAPPAPPAGFGTPFDPNQGQGFAAPFSPAQGYARPVPPANAPYGQPHTPPNYGNPTAEQSPNYGNPTEPPSPF